MDISAELRTHLDRHARLRSHLTDGDVTLEQDLEDAAALMAVFAGFAALRTDLERQHVSARNLKHIEDRVIRRAGRELLEKIWENPRRRLAGRPVLSNKFAHGGLWSPAAAKIIATGEDYKNKLILEHVVPAKTVVDILAAHAATEGNSLDGAVILSELLTHTVLTRADDAPLAGSLTPNDVSKLTAHYAGDALLSPDELFATRWSRYIMAAKTGALPFNLVELQPLAGPSSSL